MKNHRRIQELSELVALAGVCASLGLCTACSPANSENSEDQPIVEITSTLTCETTTSISETATTTSESTTSTSTTTLSLTTAPETTMFEFTTTTPDNMPNIGGVLRSGVKGTYYAPGSWNGWSNVGGSGRYLLDCKYSSDGFVKGSIASLYLYNLYGYNAHGGRTQVWLEVCGRPEMSGIYYLDDCSGGDVIDFYYDQECNCQFCGQGIVSVDVYEIQ